MKVRIYTDGACSGNPGPGGWGVVINTEKNCRTLSGHEKETTNNRMELMAVLRVFKNIATRGVASNIYEVHSDSAYVVNALKKNWLEAWKLSGWKTAKGESVKNADLWKQLYDFRGITLKKGIQVDLYKIKGHSGEMFNEMADKLAKQEVQKLKQKEANKNAN